jgi:hypothetical protein
MDGGWYALRRGITVRWEYVQSASWESHNLGVEAFFSLSFLIQFTTTLMHDHLVS